MLPAADSSGMALERNGGEMSQADEAARWERSLRWAVEGKRFGERLLCEEGAETSFRLTETAGGAIAIDWEWATPLTGKVLAAGCCCVTVPRDGLRRAAEQIAARIR